MFTPFLEIYMAVVIFVFGAIIGSFLNVVLYRMHTGKSLSGHSHCLSCGTQLRWFELFPLFSYLILRGKCRSCGSCIPSRYFLVELVTGILFLFTWNTIEDVFLLVLSLAIMSLLVLITVYDIRHTVIPNELTLILLGIATIIVLYSAYDSGNYNILLTALGTGTSASIFFGLLWFVSKGRWMGFGDVKLAFPLGMLVSYSLVFSMIVFSFWIGAIISVAIIVLQYIVKRGQVGLSIGSRTLKMKSEVPFAPFLVAGFLLTYLFGADVLTFTFYVFN